MKQELWMHEEKKSARADGKARRADFPNDIQTTVNKVKKLVLFFIVPSELALDYKVIEGPSETRMRSAKQNQAL